MDHPLNNRTRLLLDIDDPSSLGRLAAGVAHEINNPVNGIINYAQMLANRLSRLHQEREIALRIIAEGERIADTVKGLLSLAEENRAGKRRESLACLLSHCLCLVRAGMRDDGIRLVADMEADLPDLPVDGGQMRQVILNLIANARHALNDRLPRFHDDKVVRICCGKIRNESGTFIRMEVCDHWTGNPPRPTGEAPLPPPSPRPAEAGPPPSLDTSFAIIAQNNGTIHLDSIHGLYTRVIVEIPVTEAERNEHPGY